MVNLFLAIFVSLTLLRYGYFIIGELSIRIFLSEIYYYANRRRTCSENNLEQQMARKKRTMACVVGYRENSKRFTDCLMKYQQAECSLVVVGIDGDQERDAEMVDIFLKVNSVTGMTSSFTYNSRSLMVLKITFYTLTQHLANYSEIGVFCPPQKATATNLIIQLNVKSKHSKRLIIMPSLK